MLHLCCINGETEVWVMVLPQGKAMGEGTAPGGSPGQAS